MDTTLCGSRPAGRIKFGLAASPAVRVLALSEKCAVVSGRLAPLRLSLALVPKKKRDVRTCGTCAKLTVYRCRILLYLTRKSITACVLIPVLLRGVTQLVES